MEPFSKISASMNKLSSAGIQEEKSKQTGVKRSFGIRIIFVEETLKSNLIYWIFFLNFITWIYEIEHSFNERIKFKKTSPILSWLWAS